MALADVCRSVPAPDGVKTTNLVRTELEAGAPPEVILEEGPIAAMDEVGRLFSTGVFFVPQMIMKDAVPETRGIIGGAPVTRDFALEADADGYGVHAGEAVQAARRAVEKLPS